MLHELRSLGRRAALQLLTQPDIMSRLMEMQYRTAESNRGTATDAAGGGREDAVVVDMHGVGGGGLYGHKSSADPLEANSWQPPLNKASGTPSVPGAAGAAGSSTHALTGPSLSTPLHGTSAPLSTASTQPSTAPATIQRTTQMGMGWLGSTPDERLASEWGGGPAWEGGGGGGEGGVGGRVGGGGAGSGGGRGEGMGGGGTGRDVWLGVTLLCARVCEVWGTGQAM